MYTSPSPLPVQASTLWFNVFVVLCLCVCVYGSLSCVCACVRITLMYSRSSSFPDQIAQLRAGCCEIQTRRVLEGSEAASDVFLDGLNNECLKRLWGPQLPKLRPCSLTLTCSARCENPEKEGDAGSEAVGRGVSPPPHPSTFCRCFSKSDR